MRAYIVVPFVCSLREKVIRQKRRLLAITEIYHYLYKRKCGNAHRATPSIESDPQHPLR